MLELVLALVGTAAGLWMASLIIALWEGSETE